MKKLGLAIIAIIFSYNIIGCSMNNSKAERNIQQDANSINELPRIKEASIKNFDAEILALHESDVEKYYNILCELSTFPSESDISSFDIPFEEKIMMINEINESPDVIRYLGTSRIRGYLGMSAKNSPYPAVPDRCFENGREPVSLKPVELPETEVNSM